MKLVTFTKAAPLLLWLTAALVQNAFGKVNTVVERKWVEITATVEQEGESAFVVLNVPEGFYRIKKSTFLATNNLAPESQLKQRKYKLDLTALGLVEIENKRWLTPPGACQFEGQFVLEKRFGGGVTLKKCFSNSSLKMGEKVSEAFFQPRFVAKEFEAKGFSDLLVAIMGLPDRGGLMAQAASHLGLSKGVGSVKIVENSVDFKFMQIVGEKEDIYALGVLAQSLNENYLKLSLPSGGAGRDKKNQASDKGE